MGFLDLIERLLAVGDRHPTLFLVVLLASGIIAAASGHLGTSAQSQADKQESNNQSKSFHIFYCSVIIQFY